VRRTQGGNNNPYCQDNEISWLDWQLLERNADLLRFTRTAVHLRRAFDPREPNLEVSLSEFLKRSRVEWHGVRLGEPDWGSDSRSIAVGFSSLEGSVRAHCIFNAYWEAQSFELPSVPAGWRLLVDTALPPPGDARTWDDALPVASHFYLAQPRSVVVLGTAV